MLVLLDLQVLQSLQLPALLRLFLIIVGGRIISGRVRHSILSLAPEGAPIGLLQ